MLLSFDCMNEGSSIKDGNNRSRQMQTLKSLTFTAAPKELNNPMLIRRSKLITRLEEQKQLYENPSYIAVDQRWEKTEHGKELVERKRKVRRWWREDATGNVYFTVRYGQKTLEFEKGKSAILVNDKNEIPAVVDVLITAVRNGELDGALAGMSKARGIRLAKAKV
jgi:hypothetical protein